MCVCNNTITCYKVCLHIINTYALRIREVDLYDSSFNLVHFLWGFSRPAAALLYHYIHEHRTTRKLPTVILWLFYCYPSLSGPTSLLTGPRDKIYLYLSFFFPNLLPLGPFSFPLIFHSRLAVIAYRGIQHKAIKIPYTMAYTYVIVYI